MPSLGFSALSLHVLHAADSLTMDGSVLLARVVVPAFLVLPGVRDSVAGMLQGDLLLFYTPLGAGRLGEGWDRSSYLQVLNHWDNTPLPPFAFLL